MKKLSRMAAVLIALVMISSLTSCKLITKTEKGENKTVVAKANGKKLTKGEYNRQLAIQKVYLGSYYGYDFFEGESGASYLSYIRSGVLDQMVYRQVIEDKAKEFGLMDDTDTITQEAQKKLDEFIDSLSNKDGFNGALEKYNITKDDFLDLFEYDVVYQRVYDKITKDISVTDDDVKKYYDENPYEFTEKDNTMNLSHILVATEAEAKAAKERVEKGESFEDVAKAVSTDTQTVQNGGSLGDVNYVNSGLVQEFTDAAIKLKEGEISEPVKTTYGYHIIKCNSKTEFPVKAFDDVKDSIKEKLLSEKKDNEFNNNYDAWKKVANVKTYSDRI